MDNRQKMLRLRDALNGRDGEIILAECRRFMVEVACRANAPAEWIKGMGVLIGHLEQMDEECRRKFDKQQNP